MKNIVSFRPCVMSAYSSIRQLIIENQRIKKYPLNDLLCNFFSITFGAGLFFLLHFDNFNFEKWSACVGMQSNIKEKKINECYSVRLFWLVGNKLNLYNFSSMKNAFMEFFFPLTLMKWEFISLSRFLFSFSQRLCLLTIWWISWNSDLRIRSETTTVLSMRLSFA